MRSHTNNLSLERTRMDVPNTNNTTCLFLFDNPILSYIPYPFLLNKK